MKKNPNKYALYELSVQSPDQHVEWVLQAFREIRPNRKPVLFREDFCGTFAISAEWVKAADHHFALGLDLDPEPLAYGRANHWKRLKPEQRRRLMVNQENVLTVTRPGADVIFAGNFSFYIFKKREELIRYFKAARASLSRDGIFAIEMAGGPGLIAPMRETRTVHGPRGLKFRYVWHQRTFDPITHDALFSIHFEKLPGGAKMKDAFVYDWRIYSIPEVRDAMREAGFKDTVVFWESSHRGEGTGEYLPAKKGENDYSWTAYVVGVR